jgi:glycosyltransferase involved in cell wall biosynthesis
MELLIDASSLGDDSAYRGVGTYMRNLIAGLAGHRDVSVTALVREPAGLPEGVRSARLVRIAPGRWRRAEHELLLPLDLRRRDANVFHSPGLDPPRGCRTAWVQTLHDVIPLVFDDAELEAERHWWRRHAPRVRRADAIVTVSRHTAEVGIETLGLDARRIEVIPHGVGPEFRPPTAPRRAEPPYLLSVGEYSRRKGYPEAFAVIAALAERGDPHTLRVSGRIAPWVRPALDAVLGSAPRPDRVELLGFVDDLVSQYQNASLLLVTSRYEGFGLPIIEAMACGTPVVAFANSAIPEVLGDAGVLVPDGDVGAMVSAVRGVLDQPARWQELSARGIERARSFTWERSVAAHVEVYRRLLG